VDCLGPLFNTKAAYNYALVFLDKTSRFPHAIPLNSLTAKSCCEVYAVLMDVKKYRYWLFGSIVNW